MKRKISLPFKKVVTYLGSSLLALTLFFNMPVYAEGGSLSAPFVGWNVHIIDIDPEYKQIDRGNYSITPGGIHITGQLNCSSYHNTGNDSACDIYELENQSNSQVTGLEFHLGAWSEKNLTNDEFVGTVYKRIYEVEFVLDASYVGYVTFQDGSNSYTDYVNGTSFRHTFWTDSAASFSITISNYSLNLNKDGGWVFPIESFNIINQQFQNNYQVLNYIGHGQYTFPVFNIQSGNTMGQIWSGGSGNTIIYIFGVDRNLQMSNYTNSLEFENCTVDIIQELYFSNTLTIKKFILTSTNTSGGFVSVKAKYNAKYMPIYFNTQGQQQFASTDFAINFGLQNNMMKDIDHLANGTTSTNQSVSDQQSEKQNFDNSKDDLFDAEDNMNQNMNDALNNIDPDFNIGTNFGSKFINSADWVKTQFDRVTGNTPFGSVLGFSLLLGVGLLIIGKVLG